MEISILLGEKILSMLLACLVGFVVVRVGILKTEDSSVLSKVLAFICSPCAIVSAFQVEFTSDKAVGLLIALGLAIAIHVIYIAGARVLGETIGMSRVERAAVVYSNAGYLVIPLVYSVLGPEWVFYTCAYSTVQTILLWTHCKSLVGNDGRIQWKAILVNPNFLAIYAGIFMFLTGLRFPGVLQATMSDFSSLLGPLSMVIIGLLIGDEKLPELFKVKRSYFICFLRLIAIPLLTVGLFFLISKVIYHPELERIMLIVLWATAAPVGTMVAQLSQIYGTDGQYAGRLNLISVLLCLVTMPLVTYVFEVVVKF